MTPSGRVRASRPCRWMCAHKYVLCLLACIALLCVYRLYMRNMATRWLVSSEIRLFLYGWEVRLFRFVYTHPHPISSL